MTAGTSLRCGRAPRRPAQHLDRRAGSMARGTQLAGPKVSALHEHPTQDQGTTDPAGSGAGSRTARMTAKTEPVGKAVPDQVTSQRHAGRYRWAHRGHRVPKPRPGSQEGPSGRLLCAAVRTRSRAGTAAGHAASAAYTGTLSATGGPVHARPGDRDRKTHGPVNPAETARP